jgi:predicted P-loop ATPase
VRGTWLFEIADLTGMRRADVEKVKAFASRTHDRARPAYGRRRVDAPRRCIFIATTNEDEYLQSQSGNRRFWPLKTSIINIEALHRDRDQLWAEAAMVEAKGELLMLPKDRGEASKAQDERRQHDPWDDILANVEGTLYPAKGDPSIEQEWIKASEILVRLHIENDCATTEVYKRMKKAMMRLGWTADKHYFGGTKQQRGYWRPRQQDGKDTETDDF